MFVAIGGAIGTVARFLLGAAIQQRAPLGFPIGTLTINVTGSFLLGLFVRLALATPTITPEVRAFLTVGFCGGYTTFSTFMFETSNLIEDGQFGRTALYVGASILLGLLGMLAGFMLARFLLTTVRTR